MMMVERFNATLQNYSHNLATLHMLRAGLSTIAPEGLLSYLAEMDGGKKGYFKGEQIAAIWLRRISQDEQSLHVFILRNFPFANISYSAIQHFLTQGRSAPPNVPQPQQSLHETAETAVIERNIVTRLQSFVPMKYSRPTEEELSNYVICHEIAVDVRAVSKRLNLVQNNGSLHESMEIEYEKSLTNSSLASIQDALKRIQARANSLGGQWLSEREGKE